MPKLLLACRGVLSCKESGFKFGRLFVVIFYLLNLFFFYQLKDHVKVIKTIRVFYQTTNYNFLIEFNDSPP